MSTSQSDPKLNHGESGDHDSTRHKPAARIYFWRRKHDRESGPKGVRAQPDRESSEEIERLNQLRLQHLQMLTGAVASCVLFRDGERVEPLFWFDTASGERDVLAASLLNGVAPEGWECVRESDGDLEVALCLKGAARSGLKAVKSYLIHWFAAQKFPCR